MNENATPSHSPEAHRLSEEIGALETLSAVIAWGRAHPDRLESLAVITDVVVQDEFSHDAIVPMRSGLVLAIGST